MSDSATWTAERRMFKAVTEDTALIAWATDENGHCFYISPEWYRFTGTEPHSGEGFNWLTAVHMDDAMRTRQAFFSANDSRVAFGCAYRVLGADGSYHLVWDVGLPKFGEHGVFEGYFGTTFQVELHQAQTAALQDVDAGHRRVLSEREREVLALIAEGKTSETVASTLGIAARTVEAHVTKAASRLRANNRIHAIAKAIRLHEI